MRFTDAAARGRRRDPDAIRRPRGDAPRPSLRLGGLPRLLEVVPGFTTILFEFDSSLALDTSILAELNSRLESALGVVSPPAAVKEIPVTYDQLANDVHVGDRDGVAIGERDGSGHLPGTVDEAGLCHELL